MKTEGWRGPAVVLQVTPEKRQATVSFAGRYYDRNLDMIKPFYAPHQDPGVGAALSIAESSKSADPFVAQALLARREGKRLSRREVLIQAFHELQRSPNSNLHDTLQTHLSRLSVNSSLQHVFRVIRGNIMVCVMFHFLVSICG